MADPILGSGSSAWQTQKFDGTLNLTNNQTGNQSQNLNQQGTFTDAQKALQNQSLGLYQSLLQGQSVPQNFQVPQSAIDAYVQQYNKYVAPQRAAQFGSGSPTIATGLQEGLAQLIGQNSMQGMNQYMSAINNAANVAFNPTGQTQAQSMNSTLANTQNQTTNSTQHNIDSGAVIGDIGSIIKKMLFP